MKAKCAFCESGLSTTTTRKQHIIQESIGGTLSTRLTTCNVCNDHFARTVDVVVAGKFSQCMNALAFALKADAPGLRVRKKGSNEFIQMEPGNVPKSRTSVIFKPDGGVSIRAKDAKQAHRLLKTTGRKLKNNPKIIYDVDLASGSAVRYGIILHEDELRSAKKTAIEYLALRVPGIIGKLSMSREIEYVRNSAVLPDLRPIILPIYPEAELLAAGFEKDPFAHRIWIQCGPKGIDCLVGLFSSVAYRFSLGEYSGTPRTFIYQKNILKTSGPDVVITRDGFAKLPGIVPMGSDVLLRESGRMRQLYIDSCWFVDMNCRKETILFYWQELRAGTSPGDMMDVSHERIFEIIRRRIEKIFAEAQYNREAIIESKKILKKLYKPGVFAAEKVDAPSSRIEKFIWELHCEANTLHKKYVFAPDYGYENYDIVPDRPPGSK